MSLTVPIIDIAPFRDRTDIPSVVSAIDAACRNTGFLIVTGHGVSPEILEGTVRVVSEFFGGLTQERKQAHAVEGRGYQPFANMSLGQSFGMPAPPDLREGFVVKRTDARDPEAAVFAGSARLASAVGAYYQAMNEVADVIMELFAHALGLDEHHFGPLTDRHNSNLGFFHYPPMTQPPLPGQLRGGAHTDFGSVTLLYAAPSVEGLQVQVNGAWEDVPLVEDALVVNLGDLMQRWTNDLWRSTIHRVVNPPAGAWDRDRLSIAFFHQPNHDAEISSLDATGPAKYPTITSGEHFVGKLAAMAITA